MNKIKSESFDLRLQRFQSNSPIEFIETILNSIANGFIQEIESAANNHQTNLQIIGMMSVVETVSEKIFLKSGIQGCKYYLEHFVDGKTSDLKFSNIASDINAWRNVIAHQWISKQGHSFGYDYSLATGYSVRDGIIIVNPKMFFDQFKCAFMPSSFKTNYTVWQYDQLLTEEQMQKAKTKFIDQFRKR